MTEELAKLLDGEVAARFGRPCLFGSHYLRPLPNSARSEWRWLSAEHHSCGIALFPENHWLAHLLDVCGDRGWDVSMNTRVGGSWNVNINGDGFPGVLSSWQADTRLEALARAMLVVPVEATQ